MPLDFIILNLPVLICLIIGIALLIIEIFTPGFGVPGISGIILLITSIVITWNNYGSIAGLGMTFVVVALAGITVSVSLKSAATGRISKSALILKDGESRNAGYTATRDMGRYLGKDGIVITILRPAGIAEFDGERLNVVSNGEFIQKGVRVRIELIEGARILVREVKI
jgi:membrane-bound ClpP family serine protease